MLPILKKLSTKSLILVICIGFIFSCSSDDDDGNGPTPPEEPFVTDVNFWLTSSNGGTLFKKQSISLMFEDKTNSNPTITVDTTQKYQSIDGFGYTLTDGSASLIYAMSADKRAILLEELFETDSTFIGISYLRISIGASDMSAAPYTYDDMPSGQTDEDLSSFNLKVKESEIHIIALLKEILAINPDIKILATPWSPPLWMKTAEDFVGESLKPEYYDEYAQYFVKYIQAMAAEGITIDAITPQNEPLHDGNNPSMKMLASEQAEFIKTNLGPAFENAGLSTKIIVYDHNCDVADYPLDILDDDAANPYVDGSAFHKYAGEITALTQVHNAYPDKNVYFTEQWTGANGNFGGDLNWHLRELIIGASRNWSRNVLEWNLAADINEGPHTDGGCPDCLGALTITGNNATRNVSYYIIAHASKFVRPGSVRVNTNMPGDLRNVAFQTEDGTKVLIVLNDGSLAQTFNIKFKNKIVTTNLEGGSVATFVW